MKITQGKAVMAYEALLTIGAMSFGIRDSLNLLKLRKDLELQVEFEAQEKQKIIDEFGLVQVSNIFISPKPEGTKEFLDDMNAVSARMKSLHDLEIEVESAPVTIHLKEEDFGNLRVSSDFLYKLDGLIDFEIVQGP